MKPIEEMTNTSVGKHTKPEMNAIIDKIISSIIQANKYHKGKGDKNIIEDIKTLPLYKNIIENIFTTAVNKMNVYNEAANKIKKAKNGFSIKKVVALMPNTSTPNVVKDLHEEDAYTYDSGTYSVPDANIHHEHPDFRSITPLSFYDYTNPFLFASYVTS